MQANEKSWPAHRLPVSPVGLDSLRAPVLRGGFYRGDRRMSGRFRVQRLNEDFSDQVQNCVAGDGNPIALQFAVQLPAAR